MNLYNTNAFPQNKYWFISLCLFTFHQLVFYVVIDPDCGDLLVVIHPVQEHFDYMSHVIQSSSLRTTTKLRLIILFNLLRASV